MPLRALLLIFALLALPTTAAADPTPPLSQQGRWITDADGRVVILNGVNMVYKRPPYHPSAIGFDAPDARFLREQGFNTVRLGLIYAGVEPTPGAYDDAYLAAIDQTAQVLAAEKIFYQLDFHQDLYNEKFQGEGWPDWAVFDDGAPNPPLGFPGNYVGNPALWRAFDHFWANDPGPEGIGLQDRYAGAWRHVAGRFKNQPYMMGYDLLNEPWPGTPWVSCANNVGCPAFDTGTLQPFNEKMTNAIREVDPRGIVWYEPNVLFNNGPQTHLTDVAGPAGMSYHVYCLEEQPTPGPQDPAQEESCRLREDLPFQNANAHAEATGNALLMTEFGATDDLGGIERVIARAEDAMISWQYWHYCQCNDPTTTGTGPTQAVVIDPAQPPTGDNLKSDKLDVLARVHPEAVAGTPKRFGFNREERTFFLDYSTARPERGQVRPLADTEIFVPARHYPNGYDVEVSGGRADLRAGRSRAPGPGLRRPGRSEGAGQARLGRRNRGLPCRGQRRRAGCQGRSEEAAPAPEGAPAARPRRPPPPLPLPGVRAPPRPQALHQGRARALRRQARPHRGRRAAPRSASASRGRAAAVLAWPSAASGGAARRSASSRLARARGRRDLHLRWPLARQRARASRAGRPPRLRVRLRDAYRGLRLPQRADGLRRPHRAGEARDRACCRCTRARRWPPPRRQSRSTSSRAAGTCSGSASRTGRSSRAGTTARSTSPCARCASTSSLVRAFFRREEPPQGERFKSHFQFMGVEPRADLPIYIAALSPGMLRLAGEIADGVILWLCNPDYIREVVVPEVTKGREKAGKPLDGFDVVAAVPSAVTDDPDTARETLRQDLVPYFHLPFYQAMIERSGFPTDAGAPDEFLDVLAGIGDADTARGAVERYREAGATSPCIGPVPKTDFNATLEAVAALAGS